MEAGVVVNFINFVSSIDEDDEEILYELENADVDTQNLYAWVKCLISRLDREEE